MLCTPHYVRCIKPNDEKRAGLFDQSRVGHQVQYLGLLENIKVRRAGYAYRAEYHRFLERFKLLSEATWKREWTGSDRDGCKTIMRFPLSFFSLLFRFESNIAFYSTNWGGGQR